MTARAGFALGLSVMAVSFNATAAPFRFVSPTIGDVTAQVEVTTRRDDQLVVVKFRNGHGAALLALRFLQSPMGGGDVRFQSYTGAGFPVPTVIVAHSSARADGITVDLVAVGEIGGRLQRMFAFYDQDAADAVCLLPGTADNPPRVVLAQFTDGDYCFMCWPKRFVASAYDWDGSHLRLRSKTHTKHLHPDWSSALAELQWPCGTEVLESTESPCD